MKEPQPSISNTPEPNQIETKRLSSQEGIENLSRQMEGSKTTLEGLLAENGQEFYKQKN